MTTDTMTSTGVDTTCLYADEDDEESDVPLVESQFYTVLTSEVARLARLRVRLRQRLQIQNARLKHNATTHDAAVTSRQLQMANMIALNNMQLIRRRLLWTLRYPCSQKASQQLELHTAVPTTNSTAPVMLTTAAATTATITEHAASATMVEDQQVHDDGTANTETTSAATSSSSSSASASSSTTAEDRQVHDDGTADAQTTSAAIPSSSSSTSASSSALNSAALVATHAANDNMQVEAKKGKKRPHIRGTQLTLADCAKAKKLRQLTTPAPTSRANPIEVLSQSPAPASSSVMPTGTPPPNQLALPGARTLEYAYSLPTLCPLTVAPQTAALPALAVAGTPQLGLGGSPASTRLLFTPRKARPTAPTAPPATLTPTTPTATRSAAQSCIRAWEDIVTMIQNGIIPASVNRCAECGDYLSLHRPAALRTATATTAPTTTVTADTRTYAPSMPDDKYIPKFTPGAVGERGQPDVFIEMLYQLIRYRRIPEWWEGENLHLQLLQRGCTSTEMRQWLETEFLAQEPQPDFVQVVDIFLRRYMDSTCTEKWKREYADIRQHNFTTVDAYCSRFRWLAQRLDYNETSREVIDHLEDCLTQVMKDKLKEDKRERIMLATTTANNAHPLLCTTVAMPTQFNFDSLPVLHMILVNLAMTLPSTAPKQRDRGRGRGDGRSYRNRGRDGEHYPRLRAIGVDEDSSDSDSDDDAANDAATVARLEPSTSGTPTNVGKKQGNRSQQSSSSAARPTMTPTATAKTGSTPQKPTSTQASVSTATNSTTTEKPQLWCDLCNRFTLSHVTSEHKDTRVRTARPAIPVLNAVLPASAVLSPSSQLYVTLSAMDIPLRNVLIDTGAQFSGINSLIAETHGLKIAAPTGPMALAGATDDMVTTRIGVTQQRMTVHTPLSPSTLRVTFTKQLEVLKMKYDMILGIDILPYLFPHDATYKYTGRHAPITDMPSDIVVTPRQPRLAPLRYELATAATLAAEGDADDALFSVTMASIASTSVAYDDDDDETGTLTAHAPASTAE